MRGSNYGVMLNPKFTPAKNGRTNQMSKNKSGAGSGGQSRGSAGAQTQALQKAKPRKKPQQRRAWWRPNGSGAATNIFLSGATGAGIAFIVNYVTGFVINEPASMWGRIGLKGGLAFVIHKWGHKLVDQKTADIGATVLVAFAAYDIFQSFAPTILPGVFIPVATAPVTSTTDQGMSGYTNAPQGNPAYPYQPYLN
jgi:hypothetical protein